MPEVYSDIDLRLEYERRRRFIQVRPRSLLAFANHYLPHHFEGPTPEFHREIAADLETEDRAVYAAPRSHAKSTLLSLAYPIYRAAYGKSHYIVILSDTSTQAADHVGNIYSEFLTNELLTRDFPHLNLPTQKDYATQRVKKTVADFITLGNVRFSGKGAGAGLRGMRFGAQRPDLILADDLENDDSVRTAEQRDKLRDWYLKSVSNLFGADGGQLITIGTVLHRKSLLAWLLSDEGPRNYKKRLYRAIQPDGTPLWPEVWTLEKLEAKRLEIKSKAFSSEFMNEPIDEGSTLWRQGWLDANRRTIAPQLVRLAVAIDPNASDNNDNAGIVAGGIDAAGHTYTLEDNSTPSFNWARIALDTYHRLQADCIVAEKNQGGEMVRETIRAALRPGEIMPRVELVHASRGKVARADPVAIRDEQGKQHIVGDLPLLEDELVSWTPGMYSPGRLDAYVWLHTYLAAPQVPQTRIPTARVHYTAR